MCHDSVHCAALNAPNPPTPAPPGAGCVPVGWACSQCYGGHGERETPGPIPNPEAKPLSADGTALETGWESRTPPDNHSRRGSEPMAPTPVFVRFRHPIRGARRSAARSTEVSTTTGQPPDEDQQGVAARADRTPAAEGARAGTTGTAGPRAGRAGGGGAGGAGRGGAAAP